MKRQLKNKCSGGGYWREDVSVNDVIQRQVLCSCGRFVGIRWARYDENRGRYRVLVQNHNLPEKGQEGR